MCEGGGREGIKALWGEVLCALKLMRKRVIFDKEPTTTVIILIT